MRQIKEFVQAMCTSFGSSHFKLSVAESMPYNDGTEFNEKNVTQYLAELEEHISNFIIFVAQREKNPDAPISALSLDQIPLKEDQKGPLNIENMPNPNSFKEGFEEDQTTEEDIIVNKKDLYKKFEEYATKGYIDNLQNTSKGK